MGNSNCSKCCHEEITRSEISLNRAQIVSSTQESQLFHKNPLYSEPKDRVISTVFDTKFTIPHSSMQVWHIIKLQALMRGHFQRQKFQILKSMSAPKHSYFSSKDLKATIGKSSIELPLSFILKVRTYTYSSGAVYTGEWFYGFRHGKGSMKWPDGCVFKGEWSFGLPFGDGAFTFTDKDGYSGAWGSLYAIQPSKSEGFSWLAAKHEFSANFERNCEKMVKDLQAKHEADVKKLAKPKEKTCELLESIDKFKKIDVQQGLVYQGGLSSGKRHGFGKTMWENGDVYEGEWENDLQNGWGKNTWVDGSKYFGGYLNNNKHGVGEYYWEDGTSYVGEWKDNKIDGLGRYKWADGKEYIGQWKDGKMEGFGVFTWKNGRKYKGYWKNSKKHGVGFSCNADGVFHKDYWVKGKNTKN